MSDEIDEDDIVPAPNAPGNAGPSSSAQGGSGAAAGTALRTPDYTYKTSLIRHRRGVACVKFSPDGARLATASADKMVYIWDTETNALLSSLDKHSHGLSDIVWSPGGEYIAAASDDHKVYVHAVGRAGRTLVTRHEGHTGPVFCLDFNYSGDLLASGSLDTSIRVTDFKTGDAIDILPGHCEPVTAVNYVHDGTMLVSSSIDGTLRFWDTHSAQALKTYKVPMNPPLSYAKFTPNGEYVLIGSHDSHWRLYDYVDDAVVRTFTGHENDKYSISAAFVAIEDTQHMVSGSMTEDLFTWDIKTGHCIEQIRGHSGTVITVDAHPTAPLVASGALLPDYSVKLWSINLVDAE